MVDTDGEPADLGDGRGFQNFTVLLREDFGGSVIGSCLETIFGEFRCITRATSPCSRPNQKSVGGNHARVYGPQANSGAFFLAVSQELSLSAAHDIATNGYDIGEL